MKTWIGLTVAWMAAALMLGGCGTSKYHYIAAEGEGQGGSSQTQELPPIVIDGTLAQDNMIVLEPEVTEASGQEQQSDNPQPPEQDGVVSLLFGGDVLLSSHVLNAYQKAGGIGGVLDAGYRQVVEAADFFMVNQEFPFSSRGTAAEDKQYTFRLPPETVSMFQEMGIDAVTLANNHILDFGEEALLDTCATLDAAGILHTGAGENLEAAKKPVMVEREGIRIGILGTSRVMPESAWAAGKNHRGVLATYDARIALDEIRQMRTECDYVIVYVHWGKEKEAMAQEIQRTLGQQYIDAGADLVIGSHPHVLQGMEYYKGKPIVYSLGNFVFGSSIPRTALLRAVVDSGGIRLQLLPGTSGAGYTRMLPEGETSEEFYRHIEQISSGI